MNDLNENVAPLVYIHQCLDGGVTQNLLFFFHLFQEQRPFGDFKYS